MRVRTKGGLESAGDFFDIWEWYFSRDETWDSLKKRIKYRNWNTS